MTWNWEYFSQFGYASVLLWIAALLLFLVYWARPARLFSTIALGVAVAAFVCAKINSETHVNRIQLDRSAELAKQEALEEARQKEVLKSRGEDVAQIRFAEDATGDFLDRAGMDESDLKYFDSITKGDAPAWRKEKKQRSGEGEADGSLESAIGGKKSAEGVDSETLEEKGAEERPSAVMVESEMVMANRLDLVNLRVAKFLIGIGILLAIFDYLRRANIYGKASRPLPLPSSWLNALNPVPPLISPKKRNQKSASAELTRLVQRGDSFVYLTDDPARAAKMPDSIRRFPLVGGSEDLIRVTEEVDDDFVFESLWYGRSSFIIDAPDRARQALGRFLELLDERKGARAKVSQTAHIVWDLESAIPDALVEEARRLAKATGFSIFLLGSRDYHPPKNEQDNQPVPPGEPVPS